MVQAIDVILAFFTDNGMVVELMVSTLLFTWWLERRDMFWWRALTGAAVMLVESMLWHGYVPENLWTVTVQNIIVFALLIAWIGECWKVNIRQALFYFVMSGAMQHLVYRGARLLSVGLHRCWPDGAWIDTYRIRSCRSRSTALPMPYSPDRWRKRTFRWWAVDRCSP
ncbi:hypothetical protein [Bifidobacterium dentium]|uniref:hypothetical protein n=1 Tax=Bifidobacterium dentium TaxID=1689 RepID=UPI000ACA7E80|nr:hypothetical protein [Bifidobacterium dentium]